MKIIFLVPVVPPAINGIGEYTFHLVKGLREAGADAHIVTSSGQPAAESWIHPVISRWTPEETERHIAPLKPDWISLQYVPQLYHPKGLCLGLAGIPLLLKKKTGCRITVTFHEFVCAWGFSPKKFLLALMLRFQTRRLLSACDFAVTTCEVYREILQGYSKHIPVHTVPVGANILPENVTAGERTALRSKWGVGSGRLFAVFGRLSNFRNHTLALEVLGKARAQGIHASLLLIGCMRTSNPALFSGLIEKAERMGLKQWLIETGDLNPSDLSRALSASDVFLFPQSDGISTRNTTVISALAHGLPVVSFIPSPGNFDGKPIPYAALAPQGDNGQFIEKALHFAAQKPDDIKKMDQIDYYKSQFSWEIISVRYFNLMAAAR